MLLSLPPTQKFLPWFSGSFSLRIMSKRAPFVVSVSRERNSAVVFERYLRRAGSEARPWITLFWKHELSQLPRPGGTSLEPFPKAPVTPRTPFCRRLELFKPNTLPSMFPPRCIIEPCVSSPSSPVPVDPIPWIRSVPILSKAMCTQSQTGNPSNSSALNKK